jgi:hypothetical protein
MSQRLSFPRSNKCLGGYVYPVAFLIPSSAIYQMSRYPDLFWIFVERVDEVLKAAIPRSSRSCICESTDAFDDVVISSPAQILLWRQHFPILSHFQKLGIANGPFPKLTGELMLAMKLLDSDCAVGERGAEGSCPARWIRALSM